MMRSAFLCLMLASAAGAETPLDGAGFEARVLGKTLSYSAAPGAPYGVEKYLPGRRVIWSYLDGQCDYGTWYEDKEAICFVYENNPVAQCWRIFGDEAGLRAEYLNNPGTSILYQIQGDAPPLVCNDFGV